jgi:hypothetical protein
MPTIIKLTPTVRSPLELNFRIPSTLEVVTFFRIIEMSLPAVVPPTFTGVAVATGANLYSAGYVYENSEDCSIVVNFYIGCIHLDSR